jgi:hypothetical protein
MKIMHQIGFHFSIVNILVKVGREEKAICMPFATSFLHFGKPVLAAGEWLYFTF